MGRWPRLTLGDTTLTLAPAPPSSLWPFLLHLRALTRSSPRHLWIARLRRDQPRAARRL